MVPPPVTIRAVKLACYFGMLAWDNFGGARRAAATSKDVGAAVL